MEYEAAERQKLHDVIERQEKIINLLLNKNKL